MTGEHSVWRIHHRAVTDSTNRDALDGKPYDVFTADLQTAGRGRLDHRWLSPPGENLMMSAVIDVAGQPPEEVATLPLVVGLAVAEAAEALLTEHGAASPTTDIRVKWPNDVLIDERKACGILCERKDDRVIAGIGMNVNQILFDHAIANRATSLLQAKRREDEKARKPASQPSPFRFSIPAVRDAVLARVFARLTMWRQDGFRVLWPQLAARDFLKGRTVTVRRTDGDAAPVAGLCGGIRADGALDIAGEPVFAGEVAW